MPQPQGSGGRATNLLFPLLQYHTPEAAKSRIERFRDSLRQNLVWSLLISLRHVGLHKGGSSGFHPVQRLLGQDQVGCFRRGHVLCALVTELEHVEAGEQVLT